MEAMVKRLAAFRLKCLRELALRTLEAHYKYLPDDVRTAVHRVVDAVLAAEETVVAWRVDQ